MYHGSPQGLVDGEGPYLQTSHSQWLLEIPMIVHRSLAPSLLSLLLAVGLAFVLAGGCTSGNDPAAPPGGTRFGNNYEIVLGTSPAAPDEPPTLRNDTLVATVTYAGGEKTHSFDLRHEVSGDTARLWLRHDAEGDRDSTRMVDEVKMPVPQEALNAPTVVLLNPQDGEPFVLRWPNE